MTVKECPNPDHDYYPYYGNNILNSPIQASIDSGSRDNYVPIRDISPFNFQRDDCLIMALKAYWDGSGKSDDPFCRFLTLGGYISNVEYWSEFEQEWGQSICSKHGIEALHMADLEARRGSFESWKDKQFRSLRNDALNLLAHYGRGNALRLVGISASVDLVALKSLDEESISAEFICTNFCTAVALECLQAGVFGNHTKIEMFFDMNEEFLKFLYPAWGKAKKCNLAPLSRISVIAPVDHRDVIPLQAADFCAWTQNRYLAGRDRDLFWRTSRILVANQFEHLFEESELRKLAESTQVSPLGEVPWC